MEIITLISGFKYGKPIKHPAIVIYRDEQQGLAIVLTITSTKLSPNCIEIRKEDTELGKLTKEVSYCYVFPTILTEGDSRRRTIDTLKDYKVKEVKEYLLKLANLLLNFSQ